MKIKLGNKVIDEVTGFKGIATSKLEFLNGCVQYSVQPEGITTEGKMKEVEYVDQQQLKVLNPPKPVKEKKTKLTGGGFHTYPGHR